MFECCSRLKIDASVYSILIYVLKTRIKKVNIDDFIKLNTQ